MIRITIHVQDVFDYRQIEEIETPCIARDANGAMLKDAATADLFQREIAGKIRQLRFARIKALNTLLSRRPGKPGTFWFPPVSEDREEAESMITLQAVGWIEKVDSDEGPPPYDLYRLTPSGYINGLNLIGIGFKFPIAIDTSAFQQGFEKAIEDFDQCFDRLQDLPTSGPVELEGFEEGNRPE